jgi:hypothetical protein
MICDRCGRESRVSIGSMFNMDQICLDCKKLEEAHPMYEHAREIEGEAVRNGNYNFPGIGLPVDLRGGSRG